LGKGIIQKEKGEKRQFEFDPILTKLMVLGLLPNSTTRGRQQAGATNKEYGSL